MIVHAGIYLLIQITVQLSMSILYSPPSLFHVWKTNAERHNLYTGNLRNANDNSVPLAKKEPTGRLPYFTLPKFWNELNEMKLVSNPITFKLFTQDMLLNFNSVE
jgi:hypothetical protein